MPNKSKRQETFDWRKQNVLVTGGTGSFGKMFVKYLQETIPPRKLIVYSRDELKQFEMAKVHHESNVRYFLGDVRDKERLYRALQGVDVLIHAAALKQVPACEYNPFEAVQTNILGAKNIIDAAIDCGVGRVIALSTDKAVNPVNLYGATKQVAEKLIVQGNSYSGVKRTKFSCVRYGNVVGSRGSVVPLFLEQRKTGRVTVTDQRMTRFWITLEQGVRFVIDCVEKMQGGEIFIPKIPSMHIIDLAKAIAPKCKVDITGVRPGEKLHETLISTDESRNGIEFEKMFILHSAFPWWNGETWKAGKSLPEGFSYCSNSNTEWLTPQSFLDEGFLSNFIGV